MFGQNNDNQTQPDPVNNDAPASENNPPSSFYSPSAQSAPTAPAFGDSASPASPPAPQDDTSTPVIADDNATDFLAPASSDFPTEEVSAPSSDGPVTNDHLLNMKQQALQQLTPLVNHLDQSPEEKFRTVMMMIQASDDHTKLSEAFEAAKAIPDDKARAQALLDVINEINYFTQQHS